MARSEVNNPFVVIPSEELHTDYVADYFVDVYRDIPTIREPNNLFVDGARGTGKSMLFHSLLPQVQLRWDSKRTIKELPFFSVYVPMRKYAFSMPELDGLGTQKRFVLAEHILSLWVIFHVSDTLIKLMEKGNHVDDSAELVEKLTSIAKRNHVFDNRGKTENPGSVLEVLSELKGRCGHFIDEVQLFLTECLMGDEYVRYEGPLTNYDRFMFPIVEAIKDSEALSAEAKIYILIDDADNLPRFMLKIINSWISRRQVGTLCFKVGTQLGYDTYATIDGRVISEPHDFSRIDLGRPYVHPERQSYDRYVVDIVRKRLEKYGYRGEPQAFFPPDVRQQKEIEKVRKRVKNQVKKDGEKFLWGKHVFARLPNIIDRHALPTYLRDLSEKNATNTFSYAGLASMIALSDGIIRNFLDPANHMFETAVNANKGTAVTSIPPQLQSAELRRAATSSIDFLSTYLKADDGTGKANADPDMLTPQQRDVVFDNFSRLRTLIKSIGSWCRVIQHDPNASTRMVFGFRMSDEPSEGARRVLQLGSRFGYLRESEIGGKTFSSIDRRWVLLRHLAPHFTIAVGGSRGEVQITADDLDVAMTNSNAFRRRMENKRGSTEDSRQSKLWSEA